MSIPHTRGDGPPQEGSAQIGSSYSPHAWGWTVGCRGCLAAAVVFPTRVGMDRQQLYSCKPSTSIPHTRGDGPRWYALRPCEPEYSPHAWGWTEDGEAVTQPVYVFPTRVGMDR